MSYNPIPPRVWSRVQNQCTFTNNNSDNSVFLPLTGKTGTQAEADYQKQMLQKGNILQYKKNSSNITKNQRYSQICKGAWTNRTKSYATQTQTYTNPNISNLKQVNYASVPSNGATTYIPGPFNFNIPAPYGCTNTTIKDGGSLLCNTIVNPCTDEVIETTKVVNCYPTYCSDVPGQIQNLCWDSKLETWFPRQRLTMPTSGTKWPEGYKGFVSAIRPDPPYLMMDSSTCNSITLIWDNVSNKCIPISSYNIYQDGKLVQNVPYTTTTVIITGLTIDTLYSFYVTSLSNTIESEPSNTILFNTVLFFKTNGTVTYTVDSNCNYIVTFTGSGSITFNNTRTINYIVTGGGGNGGNGPSGGGSNASGGGGGGGAGGTNIGNFVSTINTIYTITVGTALNTSSISGIITSFPGSTGSNGQSILPGYGGAGGAGGAGGIPGTNGQTGQDQLGGTGGNGGNGGNGYNGYGNGGKGGKGGDTNGGFGELGFTGSSGVVVLSFTG